MNVTVLFTTYPRYIERFEYFIHAICKLRRQLEKTFGEVTFDWLVTCEFNNSDPDLVLATQGFCSAWRIKCLVNRESPGLGRCMNMAYDHIERHTESPYVLYVQDDWLMKESIPLLADLVHLDSHPDVGVIRYAAGKQTLVNAVELGGEGNLRLRELARGRPYVWSYNPFLMRVSAREHYGRFAVDKETQMNNQIKKMSDADWAKARILLRGTNKEGKPCHPFFLHMGHVTSMIEKYPGKVPGTRRD